MSEEKERQQASIQQQTSQAERLESFDPTLRQKRIDNYVNGHVRNGQGRRGNSAKNNKKHKQPKAVTSSKAVIPAAVLPQKRWQEILAYEQRFYRDITVFLNIKEVFLKHLNLNEMSANYKKWNEFFALYESFDPTRSYIFLLGKDKESQTLSAENFSRIVEGLSAVICKENSYLDQVAKSCSITMKQENQDKMNDLISEYEAQIGNITLGKIITAEMLKELEVLYLGLCDNEYLDTKAKDLFKKIIVLPMQWLAKQPLLFKDLMEDTGGYEDQVAKLKDIQLKIKKVVKRADTSTDNRTSYARLQYANSQAQITKPQNQLLPHLEIGIALIFKIAVYYKKIETDRTQLVEELFKKLLTRAKEIFVRRTMPGVLESLKEDLKRIQVSKLSDKIKEIIGFCLEVLDGKVESVKKAHLNMEGEYEPYNTKFLTPEEAYLYGCRYFIQEVIDGMCELSHYSGSVKKENNAISRFFAGDMKSRLEFVGLRLRAFIKELNKLLTSDYDEINILINQMKPPFQNNIGHLIIYRWAECSVFCNTPLKFMDISSVAVLISLLKITRSFIDNHPQQAIMDAYLEQNFAEANFQANPAAVPVKDKHLLCMFNVLHVVDRYCSYNKKSRVDILDVKLIAIKLCFQLKRQLDSQAKSGESECTESLRQLRLAVKKLTSNIPIEQFWLVETLNNLLDDNWTVSSQGPAKALLLNVSLQDVTTYLYRSIIKQSARFFISYMNSIHNDFLKISPVESSVRHFVDFCCSRFQVFYQLDLQQIKEYISVLKDEYCKSIVGLLSAEFYICKANFEKWEDVIKKEKRLVRAIDEFEGFLKKLEPIISPPSNEVVGKVVHQL